MAKHFVLLTKTTSGNWEWAAPKGSGITV
jgi:hypothetical protein